MTGTTHKKGFGFALLAFLLWSCFPFYFKQLQNYHAIEIIVHRMVWTFVLLSGFLLATKHKKGFLVLKKQPLWLVYVFSSGVLIGANWLTYVWAVNNGQIIQASLGYFIGPLCGLLLSFFVLKERLSVRQSLAISLAVLGVGVQLVLAGTIPLVSLSLAITFSVYGLMQRFSPVDGIMGLWLETALLVPLGVYWLMVNEVASSQLSFWWSPSVLPLVLAGPVTLVPLLLYNKATKLVSFSSLSLMGYLSPSIIFLIGLFYYKEPFDGHQLAVFALIWLGLLLFSVDLLKQNRVKIDETVGND